VVLVDFRGDGTGDLPGFSDLFAGEASFAQVIFRDRQSRVHFIPAGHMPISAEALRGERLEALLSALTLTYDFVLLDAPDPLVRVVAPEAAVTVVVSEHGAADPRTVRAIDRLDGISAANVLLLVVDPNLEGGVSETLPAEYRSPVEAA
jgi:MinD-like ATPase involved in chromosome partitioning or flagellar assembly